VHDINKQSLALTSIPWAVMLSWPVNDYSRPLISMDDFDK